MSGTLQVSGKTAPERDAKKAEKAEAAKNKGTPHMSKVLKAAEKLPALTVDANAIFTDVTTNFTRAQVAALAEHLMHFNRVQATNRALDKKIAVGDRVTIIGGPAKYLGKTGTISKSQRIRCYVTLDDSDKEAYCFTSDVELLVEESETLELAVGELENEQSNALRHRHDCFVLSGGCIAS